LSIYKIIATLYIVVHLTKYAKKHGVL
jgi:hypothetical protein